MMANQISWVSFGALLLGGIAVLLARTLGLLDPWAASVLFVVLLVVAVAVGAWTARMRRNTAPRARNPR
jgi:hypothetical protein